MLAGIVAVLGLIALGFAARWVLSMTADAQGHFDIDTLRVWRFHGSELIGIFGLLVLAEVVVLVGVVRDVLQRRRTSVARRPSLAR